MKKRVTKILWYGDAIDERKEAIPPVLSPNDEEHLLGLNYGEIYMCIADSDPALFIRTASDRIVYFKALDIEALSRYFLRKDRPDEAGFLINFLSGILLGKNGRGILVNSNGEASATIDELNGVRNASIGNIKDISSIISQAFASGPLGSGFMIKVDSQTGRSYIEVDELFVRIKAMFSELEIKKLSYAGGNYMFTAAGMKCGKVEEYEGFWRCYLLVDDGETAIENPFRTDDMVTFRDFNIKPGVYENVANRFYWRLCVGVGEDYIDLSKTDCEALNNDIPKEGDSLVQLGNRTDKKRQNAIILSVYGDDAPSIHQYAGINSYSLGGKEVTVISPQGNKFMGDFILMTGVNIMTQFKILENLIHSEISSVRDEVMSKDNYLYNAAFASNTNGWETVNNIRIFTVNGMFLKINNEFYSRKDAMAAVVLYDNKNVLRIIDSGVKQTNADLADKPVYGEGEPLRKFFISFRYKVTIAGTLTIGFPGQNLHFTERLEPNNEYVIKEYSGTWNGTGDFELKFTGDIYLYSLALTDNAYEDLYTKLSSEIEQTATSIRLEVSELSESNNKKFAEIDLRSDSIELSVSDIQKSVTELGTSTTQRFSAINQRADSIELSVSEVEKSVTDLGTSTTERFSSINQTVGSISASVTSIESDVAGIDKTIKEAGWLTTKDGVEIWAAAEFSNGVKASSLFSVKANEILLKSNHIRLEGIITANGNIKIHEDGSIECNNGSFSGEITAKSGKIGAFDITSNGLSNISENPEAYIVIEKGGGKFFRVNNYTDRSMCHIRGDNMMALEVSAYGDNSIAINAVGQAGYNSYAIKSTGDVEMTARSGEKIKISGLCLNYREVTSSGSAYSNDDVIVFKNTSADITFSLPSLDSGKILYLKNKGSKNVKVTGRLSDAGNGGSLSETWINSASYIFIRGDNSWNIYYCA